MRRLTRVALAMMIVAIGSCAGVRATPGVTGSPTLSIEERHRKYDDLRNSTAGIPYVVTWDFDEGPDKVVIGVGTLEAKQAVQREIAKLGLPDSSVVIDQPKPLLSEAAPFEGCQVGSRSSADEDGRLIIPEVMTPGQEFELTVALNTRSEAITRGVDSYLECWDGNDWSPRFMLQVGWNGPDAKPTARVAGIDLVDSLGLMGPGPEKLVLPDNIPQGWYRIRKSVVAGTTQHTLAAVFEVGQP